MNPEMTVQVEVKVDAPKNDVERLQARLGDRVVPAENILVYPDGVLKYQSDGCYQFNGDLDLLFAKMLATMKGVGGVGISAIQIGVPYQATIVAPTLKTDDVVFAANARIIDTDGQTYVSEGCLSMPAGVNRFGKRRAPFTVPVFRAEEVTVAYQTLEGDLRTRVATGLEARIWQHEIDHANGLLIIDRVASEFRRKEALAKYNKTRARSA